MARLSIVGRAAPAPNGSDACNVCIADATSATLAALEHGRPGAIHNIVDDEPASMEDFVGDAAPSERRARS